MQILIIWIYTSNTLEPIDFREKPNTSLFAIFFSFVRLLNTTIYFTMQTHLFSFIFHANLARLRDLALPWCVCVWVTQIKKEKLKWKKRDKQATASSRRYICRWLHFATIYRNLSRVQEIRINDNSSSTLDASPPLSLSLAFFFIN